MNGKELDTGRDDAPCGCDDCRTGLQEYLDGTLEKKASLRIFLHLRDCPGCADEHAAMQGLFHMLDSLPAREVPADFDDAILASVPYAAYRAMEPLRRERVPVYLEEHFLPAVVRSPATRLVGVAASLLAVVAAAAFEVPAWWPAVVAAGLVPELLVRAQGLGRRVVALRRAEG